MLVKYISLLPECLLALNIIVMMLVHLFRTEQTPKTFMTISKFFIGAALVGCIVFYNWDVKENWYINSPYTAFFKSVILVTALVSNFFAGKWFLNQNRSSFTYYELGSLILLSLCLAVSCTHLCILGVALGITFLVGMKLSCIGDNIIEQDTAKKEQLIYGIIFGVFLIGGIVGIYYQTHSWLYDEIYTYYQQQKISFYDSIAIASLIVCVMFLMGVAPFHLWFMQIARRAALPSASYLNLILPTAGIAILTMLIYLFNAPESIKRIFLICGCLSVVLGAIGTGNRKNLKQIFTCVGLFYVGIIIILFSCFNEKIVQQSTIFYLIYLISILGIYICLYGIRKRGEYLSCIDEISGMAEVKPYVASGLLIFSASFLGIPPLLGMLGNLTLVNGLLVVKQYDLLIFIFIMLTFLAYGLLKLIKSVYFDKRQYGFDRVDKSVYLGLFINACFLLWVVTDPGRIWANVRMFIGTLFTTGI